MGMDQRVYFSSCSELRVFSLWSVVRYTSSVLECIGFVLLYRQKWMCVQHHCIIIRLPPGNQMKVWDEMRIDMMSICCNHEVIHDPSGWWKTVDDMIIKLPCHFPATKWWPLITLGSSVHMLSPLYRCIFSISSLKFTISFHASLFDRRRKSSPTLYFGHTRLL